LLLSVSFKDLSIGNHITGADEKASGVNMAGKNFTTFLIYLNVWETKELICGFFYISAFGFVFLAASFF